MQPILDVLPDFQAEGYLRALIAIAQVDGVLPVELDYLRHQATVMGFDLDVLMAEDEATPTDLGQGCNAMTRRVILRDCIILACIDNEFSGAERQKVDEICDLLELDRALIPRFEDWIGRYEAVLTEGARLLEDG